MWGEKECEEKKNAREKECQRKNAREKECEERKNARREWEEIMRMDEERIWGECEGNARRKSKGVKRREKGIKVGEKNGRKCWRNLKWNKACARSRWSYQLNTHNT
jgi:hypothetical protein